MSGCWSEGELRAYLDRELSPQEIERLEGHLAECPECYAQCGVLSDRTARVSELMAGLTIAEGSRRRVVAPVRKQLVAGAVLALAAAVAFGFILAPKPQQPAPVAVILPAPRPAAPEVTAIQPAAIEEATVVRPRSALSVRPRQKDPKVSYYLALDDEPIEAGTVMRVALAGGMQADLIVDTFGRPRAIRPIY